MTRRSDAFSVVALIAVVRTLVARDLHRFVRQPVRIAAAVGTGIVLWLVIGGGLSGSVQLGETLTADGGAAMSYRAYLVPGIMTLVATFAAVFASLSVIEARREGLLQAALASPTPRWALALGLIGGGTTVAMIQVVMLLPLAWIAGMRPGLVGVVIAIVALKFCCVALQGLGLTFAWRCRDAAAFHSVMNLLLMPLWLLSDAFFPVDGAGPTLATIIALNPLSWCGDAVREALAHDRVAWSSLGGAALFAVAMVLSATVTVGRSRRLAMEASA